MGPTWVMLVSYGPRVGPVNLAIRAMEETLKLICGYMLIKFLICRYFLCKIYNIDGLEQDYCSVSIPNVLEVLQSCTEPSM